MTTSGALDPVYRFDLPDRLRKTLRHSEYSSADMAEYLGVGPETVSRWLNDRTKPNTAALRVWALRMGVSYEWLRDGETPPPNGGGASEMVRHQGLEPRTRWLTIAAGHSADVLPNVA